MLRFCLVFLAFGVAWAQPRPVEIVERDIAYGTHPRQVLDISVRPLETPKPAIVMIHGGGWQSGDKRSAASKASSFLSQGFAVAAMNYRLHPDVKPRDQAMDVAAAAVWIAKHANRYGIDPRQIYLTGHEAGAHLAALVGTDPAYLAPHGARPSDLGGIITLDTGVYDVPAQMKTTDETTQYGRLIRQIFGSDTNLWPLLSPSFQANKASELPPFFMAYSEGRADLSSQARPFAQAIRRSGSLAVLYEATGRNQDNLFRMFGGEDDPTTEAVINFVKREANLPVRIHDEDKDESIPELSWFFSYRAPQMDADERRLEASEVTGLITHDTSLFAGNSARMKSEGMMQGQVIRLDGLEDRWSLDLQMPRGYSRVSSMLSATFDVDGEGLPIESRSYLFAGAAYDKGAGRPGPAGVFIRTPSGNWTKQDLGETNQPSAYTEVHAMTSWRDQETGIDQVLIGASPSPLGIYRGVYDPSAPGGIQFDQTPEFTPEGEERVMAFAACGGILYAATQKEIVRRIDGKRPRWEVLLDLDEVADFSSYAGELDPYWLDADEIRSFRCDPPSAQPSLAFSALNHTWRYKPGDKEPKMETSLLSVLENALGREPHYIMTQDTMVMRNQGRDIEEWIGMEVYYDLDYLASLPEFPFWGTGFGKDAFYLVRTVTRGQVSYRIEELNILGNDPYIRPLARVRDFERSPFETDDAIYVAGYRPWFGDMTDTGWIARGTR